MRIALVAALVACAAPPAAPPTPRRLPPDPAQLRAAIAARDQLPPAPLGGGVAPPGSTLAITPYWRFIGPTQFHSGNPNQIGSDWLSGRINSAVYDPHNPGVLYAGAPSGGVWKSSDSGNNWQPLSDAWPSLGVSTIAVDPVNNGTLYVGTGDADAGDAPSIGLRKSTDGGQHWTDLGWSGSSIRKLIVDPDQPQTVLMSVNGTLWRSYNGGTGWGQPIAHSDSWCDLAAGGIEPGGARSFYVVFGGGAGGSLWRSTTDGLTFSQLHPPLSAGSQPRILVAASPLNATRIYVFSMGDRKVFVNPNVNAPTESWSDITGNLVDNQNFWDQASYNGAMAVASSGGSSPVDLVVIGTTYIYRSLGGQAAWDSPEGGHVDFHSMVVSPFDPTTIMVGNDGGAYQITYHASSNSSSIVSLNRTLGVTQLYSVAASASDPNWILGGSQDNGNLAARGDLTTWNEVYDGDGSQVAMSASDHHVQYASADFGSNDVLRHTTDGWSHSQDVPLPTLGEPAFGAVAIDPQQPTLIYVGTNRLYRGSNFGASFTSVSPRLSSGSALTAIAVAPSDSTRIYTVSADGELWMSWTNSTNWVRADSTLRGRHFEAVSVNPQSADDLLVGDSEGSGSHLHRTTNPFSTGTVPVVWTDVGAGLPNIAVRAIARDPADPTHAWYVGTDVGVFYTPDAGAHWYNATAPLGLPNLSIRDLKVSPIGYLYAATYGRGIWRATLGCVARSCVANSCGILDTGCGYSVNCGGCTAPATCGGGGTANQCGTPCTPHRCFIGFCGVIDDGCGHSLCCGGIHCCM